MIFVRHRGKSQMDYFVGEHPVGFQVVFGAVASDGEANESTTRRKRLSAVHACAGKRSELQENMRNGIAPVVGDHRIGGVLYPVFQLSGGEFRPSIVHRYFDLG